ncbi:MAG: hypothetical protein ACYTEZ_05790 [Planctomycetota bacterium]
MRRLALGLVLAAACASPGGKATLEVDGAWARTFATDRDAAFHMAMRVLMDRGYTIIRANPMGGSFTAKSAVSRTVALYPQDLSYTLAHVVVEPSPADGMRIRLSLTRTREPSGGGRRPNNDHPVRDRARYEQIFDEIERALGA